MTENVVKISGQDAISYKKNPRDKETVDVTYAEAGIISGDMGTELISMGPGTNMLR